jgi:hypothetical protein
MPRPIRRTTYREKDPPHNVRPGQATRAEAGVDFESYVQPLLEAAASVRGPGVTAGLMISGTVGSEGLLVSPGVAFDGQGRAIVVAGGGRVEIGPNADAPGAAPQLAHVAVDGVRLGTTGLTGNRLLTIRARETFDDGSFGNTGVQQMEHTPWLRLVDATATLDPAQVLLAVVGFGTGANAGKVASVAPGRRTLVKLDQGIEFRRLDDGSSEDPPLARIDGNVKGGLTLSIDTGGGKKAELNIVPAGSDPAALEIDGPTRMLVIPLMQIATSVFRFLARDSSGAFVEIFPRDAQVAVSGPLANGQAPILSVTPGGLRAINCPELLIEPPAPGAVRIAGDLIVDGQATFHGPKLGFLVDAFRNGTDRPLEVGDVVIVVEGGAALHGDGVIPVADVALTTTPYDSRACGVVQGPAAPGGRGQMVTLGCWRHCKVDADISPIAAGDLLTTSGTPGHAQKVVDRARALGAVLGKALAPLPSGKGVIPVLVSLH